MPLPCTLCDSYQKMAKRKAPTKKPKPSDDNCNNSSISVDNFGYEWLLELEHKKFFQDHLPTLGLKMGPYFFLEFFSWNFLIPDEMNLLQKCYILLV